MCLRAVVRVEEMLGGKTRGTLGAVVVGSTARGNHDANQYWSLLQCQKFYCKRSTSRAGEPRKIKQLSRVGTQAWSIGCPVHAAREGNTPHQAEVRNPRDPVWRV